MSLNKGKHIIEEIDGVRCTIVEKGADANRSRFLKKLLEHNGFTVKTKQEEKKEEDESPATFTIGVTDRTFNPVIAVYQRMLRTENGHRVTPDYWNQKTDTTDPEYWDLSKK